jgi:sigma-54 specific flagellar transcriptional regulator A
MEIRDRMARRLPDDIRARFLERGDFVDLSVLDVLVSGMREPLPSLPSGAAVDARPSSPAEPVPARRILGDDPAIVALRAAIQRIGATDETVLIHGESGTGKELVAEALHTASARRRGPLLKVNCAALVETLLLSELFGHEKGAFTGATARRQGRFELAAGGTLFLDEIGDISPGVQKALLRVLQEGTFERVGSAISRKTDCRVICATHHDLEALVANGKFREDLYYRLHGITLHVPSLRRRLGDLPLLAAAILRRVAAKQRQPVRDLSPLALAGLARHAWPGNVRELENALRSAALFAADGLIELEDFTRHVGTLAYLAEGTVDVPGQDGGSADSADSAPASDESPPTPDEPPPAPAATEGSASDGTALLDATWALVRTSRVSLREAQDLIERECIVKALAEARGNVTHAAKQLGMGRSRLSQLVKQYGFRTKEEDES